jgi:DNA-binding response OmpR family regulator
MVYKILVVDDEKDAAEALGSRLGKEGYEVALAFDGEEALNRYQAEKPDVVLLDLNMPKLNGYEVLKKIREEFMDLVTPVVIISARAELECVRKGYSLQADHYLTKPCTMENILRAITTMISLIPLRKPA